MVPLIHTYIVLKNKLRGGKIWEFISRGPKKKKKKKTKWSCSVVATMEWKQILGKGFKFLKPFPNFKGALTP